MESVISDLTLLFAILEKTSKYRCINVRASIVFITLSSHAHNYCCVIQLISCNVAQYHVGLWESLLKRNLLSYSAVSYEQPGNSKLVLPSYRKEGLISLHINREHLCFESLYLFSQHQEPEESRSANFLKKHYLIP